MALSCFLWPDTCRHSPLILRLLVAPALAPRPCFGVGTGGERGCGYRVHLGWVSPPDTGPVCTKSFGSFNAREELLPGCCNGCFVDVGQLTRLPQLVAAWVERGRSLERGSGSGLSQTVPLAFCLNKPSPFLQCGGRSGSSVKSELTDKTALIN